MITIWKTPIVATVEQVLKDLKLQLYGAGLLKEIKNTGSDLMCTCPFHANGKEHNPSCGVLLQQKVTKDKTYEAGTVHCYTCGYTADLPQFVADLLGLSSPVSLLIFLLFMVLTMVLKHGLCINFRKSILERIIREQTTESSIMCLEILRCLLLMFVWIWSLEV